jgi:hypothetical protein
MTIPNTDPNDPNIWLLRGKSINSPQLQPEKEPIKYKWEALVCIGTILGLICTAFISIDNTNSTSFAVAPIPRKESSYVTSSLTIPMPKTPTFQAFINQECAKPIRKSYLNCPTVIKR